MRQKLLVLTSLILMLSFTASACLTQTQQNAIDTLANETNISTSTYEALINDTACMSEENNASIHTNEKEVESDISDLNTSIEETSNISLTRYEQINSSLKEEIDQVNVSNKALNESKEIKNLRKELDGQITSTETQLNTRINDVEEQYVTFEKYNSSLEKVNDSVHSEMSEFEIDRQEKFQSFANKIDNRTQFFGIPSSVIVLLVGMMLIAMYTIHTFGLENVKANLPFFEAEITEGTVEELTTDSTLKERIETVNDLKHTVIDKDDLGKEEKLALFSRIEKGRIDNEEDLERDLKIIENVGTDGLGEGVDSDES